MEVTGISDLTATATTESKSTAQDLNDQFLQLLVTQLKNQDPLNPLENQEFVSELAQLQALDQSIQLAETNKALLLQSSLSTGASLIGKQVTGLISEGDGLKEIEGQLYSLKVENQNVIYNVKLEDGSVRTLNPEDVITVTESSTEE